MVENSRKELLQTQINKIKEVVHTLRTDFSEVDVNDEISYLSIVGVKLSDELHQSVKE